MSLEVRWLGALGHAEAVAEMERRRDAVISGDDGAEALLLCEHPPTITLGRSARDGDVIMTAAELEAHGITVSRASRGGDVTYHGPGQLMIYPVVRLRAGLVPLLASIGAACADIAAAMGVAGAEFRRDPAGVWVGDRKIAACGVHIRRRVMIHGFALDLATPASAWQAIVTCGMRDRPVASIMELGGETASVAAIAERFAPLLAAAVERGASITLR